VKNDGNNVVMERESRLLAKITLRFNHNQSDARRNPQGPVGYSEEATYEPAPHYRERSTERSTRSSRAVGRKSCERRDSTYAGRWSVPPQGCHFLQRAAVSPFSAEFQKEMGSYSNGVEISDYQDQREPISAI
jgi:hypothetical protein